MFFEFFLFFQLGAECRAAVVSCSPHCTHSGSCPRHRRKYRASSSRDLQPALPGVRPNEAEHVFASTASGEKSTPDKKYWQHKFEHRRSRAAAGKSEYCRCIVVDLRCVRQTRHSQHSLPGRPHREPASQPRRAIGCKTQHAVAPAFLSSLVFRTNDHVARYILL